MSQPTPRKRLPVDPSIEHLRKQAKRLAAARGMTLAKAQHQLAGDYGCQTWADLLRLVDSLQRGSDQVTGGHTPMNPLPEVANRNDLPRVRELLSTGGFSRHDLDQALARAVLHFAQRREIAELLIEHGADPNGQYGASYGPIVLVTGECLDPDGLEFLMRHGADVSFAPIRSKYGLSSPLIATLGTYYRGANARRHRCIDLLLASGASLPDGVNPAMLAIYRGDAEALGQALGEDPGLIHRRFPGMPFGNLRLAGGTLLHLAVEVGEIPCIERLLAHGANLNAASMVIDGCGGQTPIFHAIATNQGAGLPVLEYLVRRAGRWIDRDITARLMVFGQATPRAMTVWEYAVWTINAAPTDWPRSSERELDLLRILERPDIRDPNFAQAVAAIDAGDLDGLRALLGRHPHLATARAEELGAFAGPYFARPALLWFIAENPVRTGHLAPNIAAIARVIIDAGTAPADITYTLGLVATGQVPRRSGRQQELIRLLVSAGADPSHGLRSAVEHREWNAARLLLELGAVADVPSSAALGDLTALEHSLSEQPPERTIVEHALILAAQSGHADIITLLAACLGGRVDARAATGATALHQAALGGHAEAVERLLGLGADPTVRDNHYQATPADWADHGGHANLATTLRRAETRQGGGQ